MANAPHRPETFPAVSADFTGPCLLEVKPNRRSGRGRFWLPGGDYTNDLLRAGVYPAAEANALAGGHSYAVDALAALAAEEERLACFARVVRGLAKLVPRCRSTHPSHCQAIGYCEFTASPCPGSPPYRGVR